MSNYIGEHSEHLSQPVERKIHPRVVSTTAQLHAAPHKGMRERGGEGMEMGGQREEVGGERERAYGTAVLSLILAKFSID